MIERCIHTGCGFENRSEYCEQAAADPNEYAGLVITKLDQLLYEPPGVTSEFYAYSTDHEEQFIEREFTYLKGDFKDWVWPLTEARIAINCVTDKLLKRESYSVAVSWLIHQIGVSEAVFTKHYTLDVYPHAPVQTYIKELPSIPAERTDRAMTPYDLADLYTELDHVVDLHAFERQDSQRLLH